MKYILNSAVITTPGIYEYRLISANDAKEWINSCEVLPISTIGYQETCEALYIITGYKFPVNRRQVKMQEGDEALIFRLTCRLDNPELKGKMSPKFVIDNCEIGLMSKIKKNVDNK